MIFELLSSFCAMRYAPCALLFPRYAEVAELVDALDSGSSRVTPVGVRVPSSAPNALDPINLNSVIA